MVLADDLYDVDVVGPLRNHDGAVDVADLRFVGHHIAEAATSLAEPRDGNACDALDDIQLADVLLVHKDVQGAFEGREAELLLELFEVPALADVVSAFAHPRLDDPVDGHVVGELEDPAVFVVLLLQVLHSLGGQLYALLAGSQVPDDVLLVKELQYPLGCGLLAHLQGIPELPRGYGDVVVHRTEQCEFPEGEGVLLVHAPGDALGG